MFLVAGAGSSLWMVTHKPIGQASTQIKNSAGWSQLKVQWMGWLNTAVLQPCMQTTQEMTPGSTKRWRLEVKWLSSESGGNPPGLTTCAFASWGHKSLLGVWAKRHFTVRVLPLPCSDILALHTRWCVQPQQREAELWSVKASLAEPGCKSGSRGNYLRRDWQCFWRQYTPSPFEALSGIWLFYL